MRLGKEICRHEKESNRKPGSIRNTRKRELGKGRETGAVVEGGKSEP